MPTHKEKPGLTDSDSAMQTVLYRTVPHCAAQYRIVQSRETSPCEGHEVVPTRVAGEGHDGATCQLLTHTQLAHQLGPCRWRATGAAYTFSALTTQLELYPTVQVAAMPQLQV